MPSSCLVMLPLPAEKAEKSEFQWSAKGLAQLSSYVVVIFKENIQDSVVQSIVSLTSSLRGQLVKCFTTL